MASISVSATTAAYIAAGATAAAAAASAYESHEQGLQARAQAKQKARVEADKAAQDQITMRQNMLRAIASQNAGTLGGVGTGAATGFGANARRQITQSQNDLLVSKANSSAQVSLLDQQGNNAVQAGNVGAFSDLVSGAGKTANALPQSS